MKIGFDGKRATHNFRGLGNYSRSIIEGIILYSPQTDIYLYTPEYNDQRAIDWISKQSNIKIKLPESIISKKIPSIWRSFLLEKYINADNLNIYHGLSHELPKMSKKRNFKSIVTIHDLIFLRYPQFFPWIDRQVYAKKFQYSADNSDLVIAICEQTKLDIMNFLKIKEEKIVVHYQSASTLFSKYKTDEELKYFREKYNLKKDYILNVGAFEERKNQKKVVETFAEIVNEYDLDLVLIGTGKGYLQEVKDLIVKLKLQDRVHLFDSFPYLLLPEVYQCAQLFFFPSIFEGFGIPIIEALMSGVPVVTSRGSCFPESAGPGSKFINPLDVSEMVAVIKEILDHSNLSKKMIDDGLQFSKKFELENTTSKLLDIYASIL